MPNAAAYIRVSTDDQLEYSPDSQLKKIREYAHTHHLQLPDQYIYLDEGLSGRTAAKRPAFMQMIGTAKTLPKPFDVILVWKFSRFARNRQDSILYKSMLRKQCSIDVISITEQLSNDPTSILIEALLEAMDEYYSINLAQEVRRGMQEKFSRGGVISSPPFGYQMDHGQFIPNPEEAPWVVKIYEDCRKGIPLCQISSTLNNLGIKTTRGNPFTPRALTYILTNPVYTGKLRRRSASSSLSGDRCLQSPSTLITTGTHPPLISPSLFASIQPQFRPQSRPRSTAPATYMLHGLVRCSTCHSILTLSTKKQSLQCPRYAKSQCPTSHSISLHKLTQAVLTQLESDLPHLIPTPFNAQLPPTPFPASPDSSYLPLLANQISTLRKRLSRLQNAYLSGTDTLEEYTTAKKTLTSQLQILETQSQSLHSPHTTSSAPSLFTQSCSPSSPPTLNPVLRSPTHSEYFKKPQHQTFIQEITYNKETYNIQIIYTS